MTDPMRRLRPFLMTTDTLFLAYWLATSLAALGVFAPPEGWLFKDYHDARVVAWNWSFLPLDVLFALTGYLSVYLHGRGQAEWRAMAWVSLTLTFCAGLMAVAYWAILGEFDPTWLLPNLAVMLWPLFFVRPLLRAPEATVASPSRPSLFEALATCLCGATR
ncbi:YvaD family protein [Corallococcus sp. M34]|uniref:DUF5360 family protein n=1 Tax=Citreicoccus inhibens TaxID=2849499 RepID=UPI001C2389C0|nr:DUF5360 family protein [Citreicoccus inhibens]MBU8898677.1 YvaD family protein [Citreicoccus inhibens]